MAKTLAKTKPWKEDNQRFICFLDIMGFKDMIYSNEHHTIKKQLKELSQIRKSIIDIIKSLKKGDSNFPEYENCDIKLISFSDSIVFVTNENKPKDFELLFYAVKEIFKESLKLGIPIKGAISYGLLTANFKESIFFGKPLINAYLLQEEIQYYGVVLDNHAETFLNENLATIKVSNYYSMKTPLKKGNVLHTNLSLVDGELKRPDLVALYKTVCGQTRIYVDNTIQIYDAMIEIKNNSKKTTPAQTKKHE
jgi:hypothetical protein